MNRASMIAWILLSTFLSLSGLADDDARLQAGQKLLEDVRLALTREQGGTVPARCVLSDWDSRPHRAHGKKPYDIFRNLTLQNRLVTYGLKYWMNAETVSGGNPISIEGSTGLGMDRPAGENWYQNNFLEVSYGGKPVLRTVLASFQVLRDEGEIVEGLISWEADSVRVEMNVALAQNERYLTLSFRVLAKAAPQPVRIGFRAYPGHYTSPRSRRAMTAVRELAAPAKVELGEDEPAAVLFDTLDMHSSCGIRIQDPRPERVTLQVETYPVSVWLDYPTASGIETGPIRIWDLKGLSLNDAMDAVLGGHE